MNLFKTSALRHFWAVQKCLEKYQAQATLDVTDFMLDVRARNRCYRFYPQFVGVQPSGRLGYSRTLFDSSYGLTGWLPYFIKRWPTGAGKLAFKDFCRQSGLRTPDMWRSPAPDMRDFLVKHNISSFGQGLRGPFRAYEPHDAAHAIDDQSYYESFIRGRVVKAGYWESRLACIEIKDMPTVQGDGRSRLRELIAPMLLWSTPENEWKTLAGIAAYQGLALDDVPAAGQSVLVDFKYGTFAEPTIIRDNNALKEMSGSPVLRQLTEYGHALWESIPEPLRPATLFTLDAIVDAQDQVWLLEMNCNPVCHPDVYPLIFETLFGAAESRDPIAAPPPASALPDEAVAMADTPRPAAAAVAAEGMRFINRPYRVC